jgi:3-oxoacyl-[acyl-carrier protein] reductase
LLSISLVAHQLHLRSAGGEALAGARPRSAVITLGQATTRGSTRNARTHAAEPVGVVAVGGANRHWTGSTGWPSALKKGDCQSMPDHDGLGPLPADLAGRRAIVTGAASGIGLAIASRLACAGARVIAVDKDKERLTDAFAEARFGELEVATVHADLSDPQITLLADELLTGGPIELIVNNVGICTGRGFFATTDEDVRLVFETNLFGPWFFTKRLVERLMAERQPGSLLFVSSLHDHFPVRRPQYSTSKAAVAMLVRELALELARYRIRVNALSPGWIRTATQIEAELQSPSRDPSFVPMGRAGQPDDVARQAVVLLSDAWSSYVTGVNLPVDGGLGLHTWQPVAEGTHPDAAARGLDR